jgi:thioredoxin reductase/NAD-dependent dihydropyrimidine dehydrogenase PreA subunit
VRIVGDLTGIPLLKFALDSGARAVRSIVAEAGFTPSDSAEGVLDLAIVGGGVAGIAAAVEAKRQGLRFEVYEASSTFSTLRNFPAQKPIFTYPTEMTPAGDLCVAATVKESLVEELEAQRVAEGIEPVALRVACLRRQRGLIHVVDVEGGPDRRAHRAIIAIGRSGDHRQLGVPGEARAEVSNRLHDPQEYRDQDVVVVGGGDSAIETAVALADAGARVTLSYRGERFTRPKPINIERLEVRLDVGTIAAEMNSLVRRIDETEVTLQQSDGSTRQVASQAVFVMIGREAPLEFFRRSGIAIQGELSKGRVAACVAFVSFCVAFYHWKSYSWFPFESLDPRVWIGGLGLSDLDPQSVRYTILRSAEGPSFYYTLLYSTLVGVFGFRRMAYRKTPYVKVQTWTLMLVQWIPLFLLPEVLLPWLGRNEWFIDGAPLRGVADLFWESYDGGFGVERAYWRSYGFILAWPLMVYNWFTPEPLVAWLVIGFLQTFVLIPWLVWRYGKGAFCGWVCSCGALAETLGDRHRHKMPHGPNWNRLNMLGQLILAIAFGLMAFRIWGWAFPGGFVDNHFDGWIQGKSVLTYKWSVDVLLAGVLGVGLYFWFSGRVWCRFACPLAALMHIYARFSQFRIFSEKKKCISCNVCTSVCHQGIDVMSFANKGLPMNDPQCVRCSACVQSCPTAVLRFGRVDGEGVVVLDGLDASLTAMNER